MTTLLQLTQLQDKLVRVYAKADYRNPDQMLALLLIEGFRFLHCDNSPLKWFPNDYTNDQMVQMLIEELEEALDNE